MIFPADLLCYGFNKAPTMVPYKKHQLREELYQNCDLPKLKGNETQATEGEKHKTTGQSLESLVKDCSLNSGRTFQQCGKTTASAIKNSRLSFVKMGGRQGFGTDQQYVHKGICCATSSC